MIYNNFDSTTKLSIIGASSFAKEVYSHIKSDLKIKDEFINFYVDDKYLNNKKILNIFTPKPISSLDINNSVVFVALGNSLDRSNIVKRLPTDTMYFTFVHSTSSILLKESISIGSGSIICAGTIITCDIIMGEHVHLNLNTTIGHDTIIGDFFTTAPGVNVSGGCNIGNRVYCGTNSSIKDYIKICDDVLIGMNTCVNKDITESGTYVGIPVKRIK